MSPHNVPFVVLGAGILWFGWFGFNAGSALGANALASSAFVNTQLGAAAAVLGWIVLERLRHRQGHDDRRRDGGRRRPRDHHAGRGLRGTAGCPRDRPRRGPGVLPGGEPEGSLRLRRLVGRRRCAHGRRRHRGAAHRRVRQPRHQRGRCGREPDPGGEASDSGRRHGRLLVPRNPGDLEDHGSHGRSAGHGGARRRRLGRFAARRGRRTASERMPRWSHR